MVNDINVNRKGYKKTSLGWIPEDWEIKHFGEVFNYLRTFSYSRECLTYDSNVDKIKYIHYGDIHASFKSEFLDFDSFKRVPFLIDSTISKSASEDPDFPFLKDGDLIIVDVSEDYEGIGKCIELTNVNNSKAISGLHTFAVRDSKGLTANGFRTYILNNKSIVKEIKRIATGISVYGISKSNLSKINIIIPSISEQILIAKLLNCWNIAVEKTQDLIELKEKRKKALMQQLLSGKKRVKGFNDKWKTLPIADVVVPTLRPVNKPTNLFLALGIRSHGKGTFLKHNFNPDNIEMDILYEVKENDLITNITFAWEGAIAIVKKDDEGALVSHRFPTYTFNSINGVVDYFRYIIIQPRFKYFLELISPGGAGRNRVLNKNNFLKLEIKLPSVKEQKAIASILRTADKEIDLLNQKLESFKKQKKGLMQVLLTGKIRVKTK